VIRRDSRIDLHWRLDEPNPWRKRAERLFREGNLYRRQVDTPELTCAALGEVTKRVPAPAPQLQSAQVGLCVQEP
jgi:hypothetical protein